MLDNFSCGPYPLHFATQHGDLAALTELLDSGAASATDVDEQQITCLHWAALNGYLQLCSLIIARGGIVDAHGGELKATPLMWAARNAQVAAVHLLLKAGANPSLVDEQGFNTLHLATHSRSTLMLTYLLTCNRLGPDAIIAEDRQGHTSLHWACYQGDSSSVKLLIDHGACVSAKDNNGMTPLHLALTKDNTSCIKTILMAGADVQALTVEGKTPREMANKLKLAWAWAWALGEAGFKPDGTPRQPSLSAFKTRLAIFGISLLVMGFCFHTFQSYPQLIAWPLVIAEVSSMHLFVTFVLLDANPYGGGSRGYPITRSPYLASIITASLFWVGYIWFTRLVYRQSDVFFYSCPYTIFFCFSVTSNHDFY